MQQRTSLSKEKQSSGQAVPVFSPPSSTGKKKLYAKLANGKKILIKEIQGNGYSTLQGSSQQDQAKSKPGEQLSGNVPLGTTPGGFKGINYQRIRQLVSPPERQVIKKQAQLGSVDSTAGEQSQELQTQQRNAALAAQQEEQARLQAVAQEKSAAKAKVCLSCEGMKDFVSNLQTEIQRLASITNDLQRQLIECGGTPEIPDHLRPDRTFLGPDGKTYLPGFKNICPSCKTFKQTLRPTSAGRIRQQGEFRIRKNQAGPRRIQTMSKEPALGEGEMRNQQLSRVSSRGGVTSLGNAQATGSGQQRRRQLLGGLQ